MMHTETSIEANMPNLNSIFVCLTERSATQPQPAQVFCPGGEREGCRVDSG